MASQNIYEYKKITPLGEIAGPAFRYLPTNPATLSIIFDLRNKINELVIQLNQTNKDFELYKKAFKQYVSEHP